MAQKPAELIGARFDKLVVKAKLDMTPSGARWLCECDCGNTVTKITTQLRKPRHANGYEYRADVPRGDRLSIERINPAVGYCPENCEWITGRENSRRMAKNRRAKA